MPNTAMFHKLGELENCDVYLEKYSRSLVCVAGEALQQLSNDCDRDVTVSDKVFEVLRTSRLNQEQLHPSPVANSPRKSGVELTLITTDSCNFACRYCFASELYQGSNTLKPDDIVRYVENFLKVCQSPVSSLILFGGEPLLAFNSIRQAWPDVKGLFRSHQEEMPSFAIVTNGSLINHDIATFFAENDFAVTVSLDGPKKVHDMCRPTRKGGSSYELVVAGIKELSRAGVYYAIEATYTSQHLELGIDVVEIIDHALSLGAQEVHVMPAFPEQASGIKEIDNDHVTSFFRDAATRSAKSYLKKLPHFRYLRDGLCVSGNLCICP
jgi:sulfatase maturation enzyme AslB (radical SAM superfamily)